MTSIYLICNNDLSNNLKINYNDDIENKREKRILSVDGIENSKTIADLKCLENVEMILSSNYVSAMETSRYLANKLNLDIEVTKIFGERKVGTLNENMSLFREMQEHNFDYKLENGESLNDCRYRLLKMINKLKECGKDVAIFTHHVAIISLLSLYCEKGFNLDNRLILNYNDNPIIDGTRTNFDVFKIDYENGQVTNIERIEQ
ncbi:MAG: histidine phosphatase family protein [Bacilli bacterium]|nr:histidine phosphatase family protein [Bacilli bacterium]